MEWEFKEAKFGDVIRTKVSFYYHYGIFVSDDRIIQFGLPDDPTKPANDIKVLVSDIYTFLAGRELEVAVPKGNEKRKMRKPKIIVQNAEAAIGRGGYDLFHNNCEHFVYECAFKEHISSLDSMRDKIRKKLKKE